MSCAAPMKRQARARRRRGLRARRADRGRRPCRRRAGGAAGARHERERAPMSIAVLEPRRPPPMPRDAPLDLRVSAFSRASERILTAAGAWPRNRGQRISPYERMRVWHESASPTSADALVFDAAEVGEPNLGYIIETRLVQHALLEAAEQAGARIVQARAVSRSASSEDAVNVETSAGSAHAQSSSWAQTARSPRCEPLSASPPRPRAISRPQSSPMSPPHAHTSARPGSASCAPERWRSCRLPMAPAPSSGRQTMRWRTSTAWRFTRSRSLPS